MVCAAHSPGMTDNYASPELANLSDVPKPFSSIKRQRGWVFRRCSRRNRKRGQCGCIPVIGALRGTSHRNTWAKGSSHGTKIRMGAALNQNTQHGADR
jgi:hypothetical protein